MNNTCEQINKTLCQQPTLMEMMQEVNRLHLENAMLKADFCQSELEKEQLRNENMILHNTIENKNAIISMSKIRVEYEESNTKEFVDNDDEENTPNEYIDFLNGDESIDYTKAYSNVSLKEK